MPRGKYVNHKGRSRNFTSPEELEEERKKQSKNKYRQKTEEGDEDETDSEEEVEASEKPRKALTKKPVGTQPAETDSDEEDEDEDDDSEDDSNKKAKGVSGLIDIENPNRIHKKSSQKVAAVEPTQSASSSSNPIAAGANRIPVLTRREREEIEKQRSQAHYQKLHAEGKTEQARADLARLAIIKQHRAEAAARREQEKKEKEQRKTNTAR